MTNLTGMQADVRPEDEPLPFLSNFQDFFLSIGVLIFLGGISILIARIGATLFGGAQSVSLVIAGLLAVVLAVVWVLSEIIVRKRRRILPGIILCGTFLCLVFSIYLNFYIAAFGENAIDQLSDIQFDPETVEVDGKEVTHEALRSVAAAARDALPWSVKGFALATPLVMLAAAFVYYRRFRLPFSSAMVGLGLIGMVCCALFFALPYDTFRWSPTIGFLSGFALLVGGVGYDMRDPERVTRWSGNGFWLHFFAAPLLLTNLLTITSMGPAYDIPQLANGEYGDFNNPFTVAQSVVTLVVIAVFAVVSLLLNRRALVVAGLVSAGIAIGVIVNASGLGGAEVAALTLIVLGGGILLLGLGWNGARKALLTMVPSGGFWDRIFPRIEDADG